MDKVILDFLRKRSGFMLGFLTVFSASNTLDALLQTPFVRGSNTPIAYGAFLLGMIVINMLLGLFCLQVIMERRK